MSEEFVVQLTREAFYYVLIVAGPLLVLALVVGLIISVVQAATSINEQTLSFVPKLILVFLVTVLAMPFMISNLKTYAISIFQLIPTLK